MLSILPNVKNLNLDGEFRAHTLNLLTAEHSSKPIIDVGCLFKIIQVI